MRGEFLHRFNELAWARFTERKWVVGAESDTLCPEEANHQSERVRIMDE